MVAKKSLLLGNLKPQIGLSNSFMQKAKIKYSLPSFLLKKRIPLFIYSSIFAFLITSCKFSKENEKFTNNSLKNKALTIVENAINSAGTIERWQNIASIKYTKTSRLLLENGEIESEITQDHHYVLRPHKSIKISWTVKKDNFLILDNDSISIKYKNGKIIAQGNPVKSAVNSSLYVLGMPFKLLDNGTTLTYEGQKSINTSDTVHIIKATYEPKKHLNHSNNDVWWYHFNKNNSTFLSSMVYHKTTYALIENVSVSKKDELMFPKTRRSYRCNQFGKKLFLRAEFWYKDYSIEFLN